jgi:hypothetical protein
MLSGGNKFLWKYNLCKQKESKHGPDVFNFHNKNVASLIKSGIINDLSNF